MVKGKKKRQNKAKERREATKKVVMEKLKTTQGKEVLDSLGFISMAYVIKMGAFPVFDWLMKFDPKTAADGLTSLQVAEQVPTVPGLAGPKELAKLHKLSLDIATLPVTIAQRITSGLTGRSESRKTARRGGKAGNQGATPEQELAEWNNDIDWALAQAELYSWLVGLAGAWALGKFLSETTITEIVDALDSVIPFT